MFTGFGNQQPTFMGGGGLFGMMAAPSGKFNDYFRCYPITMMQDANRQNDANYGGKIFLPQSALHKLTQYNIRYPMLFHITCESSGQSTHSGVLEFTAEEGRCYMPQWMLSTVGADPGSLVNIVSTDLSQGTYVKLEPQSVDFLDISDPKAVLENALRKFTTLTKNDIIELNYNDTIYRIKILEVKPDITENGICVIETDLETEFAPPVGYVEPDYKAMAEEKKKQDAAKAANPIAHNPSLQGHGTMAKQINYGNMLKEAVQKATKGKFSGEGVKVSGKKVVSPEDTKKKADEALKPLDLNGPGVPLVLPDGYLFLGYPVVPYKGDEEASNEKSDENKPVFSGQGQSLRSKKRKDKNKNHPALKDKTRSPEAIEID